MGNCINKTSSRHLSRRGRGDERRLLSSTKTTTSNSSVTPTACLSPLSSASTSSPRRSPASPGRHETLSSTSVAAGSPRSTTTINNSADSLDHQRAEGQQRLRDLVVTGAEAGEIDWKAIIALAEDLHKKEQQLLRSSSSSVVAKGGRRTNISRKQAFFERRRKKKDLSRRKKMESVGSFSVNLLMYDADEYRAMRGHRNNCVGSMGKVIDTSSSAVVGCASSHNNNTSEHGSESEEEVDVFEDDDSESLSSSKAPIPTSPPTINKPQFIVEGSFMAATSLLNLPTIDDEEGKSSSSSSSNSSTASDTFGRSFNDDLVTIHEDSSVSTWQHQWKQYLR